MHFSNHRRSLNLILVVAWPYEQITTTVDKAQICGVYICG